MYKKIILLSFVLSMLFSMIFIFFFSKGEQYTDIYIVQVGIYENQENANNMIETLNKIELQGHIYIKDNNHIVLGSISTSMDEANRVGDIISTNGTTCVIKKSSVTVESIALMEAGDFTGVLKELSS